jgi:N-acetylneuraminic acid mutarotase
LLCGRRGNSKVGRVADNFYAYSPRTNSWKSLAALPFARANAQLATTPDGTVLSFGGFTSQGIISNVDAYSPTTNTWSARKPIPFALRGHTAVTARDGRIYLLGGFTGPGSVYLASVVVYDPSTDTWADAAPMPVSSSPLNAQSAELTRVRHYPRLRFGSTQIHPVISRKPSAEAGWEDD